MTVKKYIILDILFFGHKKGLVVNFLYGFMAEKNHFTPLYKGTLSFCINQHYNYQCVVHNCFKLIYFIQKLFVFFTSA